MDDFVSILSVIALWIGASTLVWLVHRYRNQRRLRLQIALAQQAKTKAAAAQEVFDAIRQSRLLAGSSAASLTLAGGEVRLQPETVQLETHALLKRIQVHAAYFDSVNALMAQIRRVDRKDGATGECLPLSELLHIRRDLWAAAEIVLMEDVGVLGEEFAEDGALQRLRVEAIAVLFKGADLPGAEDAIDLRVALARDEAAKYVADIAAANRATQKDDRLPTVAEFISYPVAIARALPEQLRAALAYVVRFSRYVLALAGRLRESRSVTRGVAELRRVRGELPQRFAAGVARASAATKQRAQALRRHQDFIAAAHEVQERYAQLVRKAPELTERGRQFIARLELQARSERLRLTSANCWEWLKRRLVRGLARVLAEMPHIQRRIDVARADTAKLAAESWAELGVHRRPLDELGGQGDHSVTADQCAAAAGREGREEQQKRHQPGA